MAQGPIIETTAGRVRGSDEEEVLSFLGIPYAEPPVGERRLRSPEPHSGWSGVRDATAFGPIAPQNVAFGASLVPGDATDADEDCLTLNVWTPACDDARRPVMVWLHGGAFVGGAGSSQMYRGNHLAARGDVVVVTINYRLGALGFLAHPSLRDDTGSAGNWGILDQITALEWVRDNIEAFGGDPEQVTVFGESAGAMSTGVLLAAPAARGLFSRAILQSGHPLALSMDDAARNAEAFFRTVGVDAGDIDALRRVPVEDILAAQQRVVAEVGSPLVFQPVVDGSLLDSPPLDHIRSGSAKGVATIVGTNLDEMKFFAIADARLRDLDEVRLRKRLHATLDTAACDAVVDAYRTVRSERGEPTDAASLWAAIESDRFFRIPALRLADVQAEHDPATYTYLFTWPSPAAGGALGACHALELGFVFGTLRTGPISMFTGTGPEAEALSQRMMDAWLSFARTGDPGWPAHDAERRPTMVFDADSRVEDDPYGAERRAWEALNSSST